MDEGGGLWFGVLGPLEVRREGAAIPVTSRTQRLLLVRMLVQDGPVSEDALVDAVWGDRPPPSAMNSLRAHLSRLRTALSAPAGADVLAHGPAGYRLSGTFSVDARRFEEGRSAARGAADRGDVEEAHHLLQQALSTWRGEPLADVRFEPFAQPSIARLEGARLQAQEDRIALALRLGRPADVIQELEELTRRHPFRERLVELLMLALDGAGRRAEALEVFRRAGALQRRELGLDPSPALQQLHRGILEGHTERSSAAVEVAGPAAPPADRTREAWRQLLDSLPVPEIGDELRADLLLARAEGLRRAGRVDEARSVFAAAARVAFAGDRPEQIATAVLGLIGPPEDSLMGVAVDEALVERAMIRLPAGHHALPLLRARLAVALLDRGDHGRGHELLQASLEAAEQHGDTGAAAYALRARHRVWFDPAELPLRIASARRLLALGLEDDRPDVAAWGHRWCAIGLLEAGELAEVVEHLDALDHLADVDGDAFHRWFVITRRAGLGLLREPGDSADTAVMEAVSLTDQVRSEYTTFTAMQLLWASHYLRERWEDLLRLTTVMAAAQPTAAILLPLARAKCGELEAARDAFGEMVRRGVAPLLDLDRIRVLHLLALTMLAETAAMVGTDEHAHELYELLSPYAGRLAVVPPGVTAVATVDHALGRLSEATTERERARRHYEDALALCRRGGIPVLAGQTGRAVAALG